MNGSTDVHNWTDTIEYIFKPWSQLRGQGHALSSQSHLDREANVSPPLDAGLNHGHYSMPWHRVSTDFEYRSFVVRMNMIQRGSISETGAGRN